MIIELPSRFNRITMYGFINKVINDDKQPVSDNLVFDFRTLNVFIEPSGVTILSNLIRWLNKKGAKVLIIPPENLHNNQHPGKFLDDSKFFEIHLGKPLRKDARVRSTTLTLKHITTTDSTHWLSHTFIPWLSKTVGVAASNLATVRVCMEEVINNVSNHSALNTGCIFAQHIPKNKEVVISISDFGVGIPYNVRKELPHLNDSEAIRKATELGFTTQSSPQNRGAGLDNLIHNIVMNGMGSVHIHSLNGILNCNKVDGNINYVEGQQLGYYPGTLIDLIFKTNANLFDIEEEEFSWEDW